MDESPSNCTEIQLLYELKFLDVVVIYLELSSGTSINISVSHVNIDLLQGVVV